MKALGLSRTARLILRDLSAAEEGLYPYTIYRRYKLSPSEISHALRVLVNSGIVAMEDKRAYVTENGREWVKTARLQLWQGDSKPWRECPPEFKQAALPVDRPFAPRITLLDKRTFPVVHIVDSDT